MFQIRKAENAFDNAKKSHNIKKSLSGAMQSETVRHEKNNLQVEDELTSLRDQKEKVTQNANKRIFLREQKLIDAYNARRAAQRADNPEAMRLTRSQRKLYWCWLARQNAPKLRRYAVVCKNVAFAILPKGVKFALSGVVAT